LKRTILFLTFSLLIHAHLWSQWTHINSFPAAYTKDIISSGSILYAGSYGTGIYKSTDASATWVQVNNGLITTQSRNVNQLLLTGSILYSASDDGIYKSTDGGSNWVKKSTGLMVGGGALYLFTMSIYENNGVLFTGAYTGIYRSTDGSESWQVTNISGSAVMAQYFVNHNGILFAARETNNMPYSYTSSDGGSVWSELNNINFPTITYLSEGSVLWAGTIDGVWLSTNNGLTWYERNNGLSADPYSSSIIRVNGMLITSLKFGGSGVYRSSNNGLNWENIGSGLPFLSSIEKLFVYNNNLIAATSQGLYERNLSEIVGIQKGNNILPQAYRLHQNYPNPFNPSTIIKFDVPDFSLSKESLVTLKIYDALGREISVLVNGKLSPGAHEVNWDASNFPSGIYYYKLESGNFSESRKMILLK
jgi:photosystem II stability/assembly factor-like uncharacterized protein